MQSTEPQARKVQEKIRGTMKKKVAKKKRDTGARTTAKSPPGVMKTKAEGQQSLAQARKRQQKRVQEAKQKKR